MSYDIRLNRPRWYNCDMHMQFEAEVRQVKTMPDRSTNVTLNLPEYQLREAQEFMALIHEMIFADCFHIVGGNLEDDRNNERTG